MDRGDSMSGLQAVEVMKKGNMVMRKTSLGTDMIYKFDQFRSRVLVSLDGGESWNFARTFNLCLNSYKVID